MPGPVIHLRNTLAREVEKFVPHDPQDVRMYVCGPTVYDRAHLGNARPVVVFDVLFRLLRHVYGAEHVTYVRNFTDVDDKINAEALRRRQAGAEGTLEELIRQRTEETIAWYHEDMDALGALRPSIRGKESPEAEPRATEWIGAMIAMIKSLCDTKNEDDETYAYEAKGHVLFRVRAYKKYGALSGRTLDDMIAGARVEVAPFKEDPLDFVLWKPSDAGLPGWDSPWGRGRPGWHIECSAMSHALLGESFDIHGGGIDLQFPHHENEIAQSACAHPEGSFAKYWLHNEMVMVDGKKMSKSLGNFFTVRDLLDQGIDGEVIRLVLLMTHYRKPMDWTETKVRQAEGILNRWRMMRHRLQTNGVEWVTNPEQVHPEVLSALADDLNTWRAISNLQRLAADVRDHEERDIPIEASTASWFFSSLAFLGFTKLDPHGSERRAAVERAMESVEFVNRLVDRLKALRAAKNWDEADALRGQLIEAGLELQMKKDGEIEWDTPQSVDWDKLEGLE